MSQLATALRMSSTSAPTERTFTTWDGTNLFYRAWQPAVPSKKAVLLFHRGHEHSGRLSRFVKELGLRDSWVFAWDARGHGHSPGERGYADSFSCITRDIDTFVHHICSEYQLPMEDMILLGHSVGAVAVAAWVHDYAPPVRAMILVTPAFRVKLYVPFALPALRLRMRFGGKSFIKSYVRPTMLTHDPEQAEAYRQDPLISRNIATNILLDLYDTSTRLLADAAAIRTPTLLLSAGSDWVVKNSAQRCFFDSLSSSFKCMRTYPGFFHAILHERDRAQPIAHIRQFIQRVSAEPRDASSPPLDGEPYARTEYERLSHPLPLLSIKRAKFSAQRLFVKTICRLSNGIRLGWQTGFDSGQSLDYIYQNRPRGITPLGTLIDRIYLNAIGWRGIRQRRIHLQLAMRNAIREHLAAGRSVRILDVASGPGRYDLEVLSEFQNADVTALLRDRSPNALDAGRELAGQLGIASATFAEGDAFDANSLSQIQPRPNIAIVSGLYELVENNQMLLNSLRGLSELLAPGDFLIYTNQPWHPQLEMIARVLVNRDQKPWIMRCRTQPEMDELVRLAGFEKVSMMIDRYGIFTVSIARRAAIR